MTRNKTGLRGAGRFMVGAVTVALMGIGCSADENGIGTHGPSIVQQRQTEDGFKYTATNGAARITLTVQRNGLRGVEFVVDPANESLYQVDYVIRNRHGFPFLTSGIHGVPVDVDEGELSLVPKERFYQQDQLDDLQLVIDTADILANKDGIGTEFMPEIKSIRGMADLALQDANNMFVNPVDGQPTPSLEEISSQILGFAPVPNETPGSTSGDVGQIAQAYTSPYKHQVYIRRGPCVFCGDTGEHSAVLLNVYDNNNVYMASVSTQNHGTEASLLPTTAFNCPKTFSGRTVVFPNFQPYESTDVYLGIYRDGGGCHTSYGITSGHHVCNDDSQAEYNNIKYNLAGTWTFCQDSTLAFWAPYCN